MFRYILCVLLLACSFCHANVCTVTGDSSGITYKVDQYGSKKSKKKKSAQEIRKLSHEQMEPFQWEIGINPDN